jgi:hypothetical protein
MSGRRRCFGAWGLAGAAAAVHLRWGPVVGDPRGSVVRAQQDARTTEAARHVGVRLLDTRDASR